MIISLSGLKKIDWFLAISAVLLSIAGLLSLYSLGSVSQNLLYFKKQLIFLVIGISLMFLTAFFDYRVLKDNSYLVLFLYVICLALLLGLFLFAFPIRGVRSWYRVGNVSFDPAEFSKLVLIILLAKYFSYRHVELYKLRHIFLSGFYMIIPAFLVYLQPNLGSAIIFAFVWLGTLLVSGIKLKHFLLLILFAAILGTLGWSFFLKDYQRERIISFLFPDYKPFAIGWNQKQAKIALGSGGWLGKGFGSGSQAQYGFLPEPKTDFIFSAIGEEFGFGSIIIVLFLFMAVFFRMIKIALMSENNFARLFSLGIALWMVAHLFVNIGSNVSIVPVIGLPLPFVSYGGSSLIAFYLSVGILQSIRIHTKRL